MSIKKKVKNYNVLIEEGLRTRQMYPTDILKVDNTDSTDSLWMPQDNANYGTLYASENGIYIAARDGYDAYSEVDVRVTFDDFSDLDIDNLDGTWDLNSLEDLVIDEDLDIDEFDDLFNNEDLWDDPFDKIDSSFDDRVTGIDPVSGNEYAVGLDANGYLDEYLLPSKIRIIKPPNKITYINGEVIDYTGIVVMALTKDSKPWKNENYPDGIIPFEELIFQIEKADATDVDNIKYVTSELDTSPFEQPICIATKEVRIRTVDRSFANSPTEVNTKINLKDLLTPNDVEEITSGTPHPENVLVKELFRTDSLAEVNREINDIKYNEKRSIGVIAVDATDVDMDKDFPDFIHGINTPIIGSRAHDDGIVWSGGVISRKWERDRWAWKYLSNYYTYKEKAVLYEEIVKFVRLYDEEYYEKWTTPDTPRNDLSITPNTSTNGIYTESESVLNNVSWTIVHGDKIGGVQEVPVQWKRPDGEILEDTLYLNVSYPNETVPDHDWNIIDPTINPHDIPETPEGEVTPEVEVTP